MTLLEVGAMLSEICSNAGLNGFAYYSFTEQNCPQLPYCVYYYPNSNNEAADNVCWATINALNIELYTEKKDFESEKKLESVLRNHGFFFNKTESYLTDENMYEVLYEMEVVINE